MRVNYCLRSGVNTLHAPKPKKPHSVRLFLSKHCKIRDPNLLKNSRLKASNFAENRAALLRGGPCLPQHSERVGKRPKRADNAAVRSRRML